MLDEMTRCLQSHHLCHLVRGLLYALIDGLLRAGPKLIGLFSLNNVTFIIKAMWLKKTEEGLKSQTCTQRPWRKSNRTKNVSNKSLIKLRSEKCKLRWVWIALFSWNHSKLTGTVGIIVNRNRHVVCRLVVWSFQTILELYVKTNRSPYLQ